MKDELYIIIYDELYDQMSCWEIDEWKIVECAEGIERKLKQNLLIIKEFMEINE